MTGGRLHRGQHDLDRGGYLRRHPGARQLLQKKTAQSRHLELVEGRFDEDASLSCFCCLGNSDDDGARLRHGEGSSLSIGTMSLDEPIGPGIFV